MDPRREMLRRLAKIDGVEIKNGSKHQKVYYNGRYVLSMSRGGMKASQDKHARRHMEQMLRRAGVPF